MTTGENTLPRPVNTLRLLLLIVLIAVAGFILWPYIGKMTVPDESTFIYESQLISRFGELPYKDFFDFVLPGTFYIAALVNLVAGGVSLVALRLVALLALLICCVLTFVIGKRYLAIPWLWIMGITFWLLNFPAGVEIQHHLFSSMFGMLAVFLIWRSVPKRSNKTLVVGGICMGLSALCTQSLGGVLGFAMMVFLCWHRGLKQTLVFYVLPACAPVLLLFGYFSYLHAFDQLWYSTVTWLFEGGYSQTSSMTYLLDGIVKFASITQSTIAHPSILWKRTDLILYLPVVLLLALLPPLGLFWPVEYLGRRVYKKISFETKDWQLACLWFAAAGFFIATLSYPNTRLVAYHGFIPILLAIIILQQLLSRFSRLAKPLCIIGLVYTLAFLTTQGLQSWIMIQLPRFESYGTVEKTLYAPDYYPPDYVNAYNQLVQLLHTVCPPGESMFIYNHAPELYLLTNRHNPTRYQLLMHRYNTPAQVDEAVTAIAHSKPEIILYDQQDARDFKMDHRFRNIRHEDFHLHGIEEILQAHYQPVGQMGNDILFQKRH